jgi:hypothetical protein
MREKYPNDYKNITFVFNDIDTMPFTKNFLNYETHHGKVKHFYGYEFALGGIVSITGKDFEAVNGFPNYWSWGFEDNLLNIRIKEARLFIDRSQFYPLMDKNIMQLKDGLTRIVNKKEFDRYVEKTKEGVSSIQNLNYEVNDNTGMIDIKYFLTEYTENRNFTKLHDLRNGSRPFLPNQPDQPNQNRPNRFKRGANATMKMFI